MLRTSSYALLSSLLALTTAGAQQPSAPPSSYQSDSIAVVTVASRFHQALARGDTAAVDALLASDLQVLESGGVENRAEYFAHHLAADMEFARTVPSRRALVSYVREGNSAWLVSNSSERGTFRNRDVNSVGAELMILTKNQAGWQIRAIHWSSRRIAPS